MNKVEIKQKRTLNQRNKSYIDSELFKNISTEITKNLAPLKNELARYRVALDSVANFLEAQDLAIHKEVIDNLRSRATRVKEIIEEIQNPGEFIIQDHGDSKIDIKKLGNLEAELNEMRNSSIGDLETVRLNVSKRIDLKEIEYSGKIASLKAEIKQARFSTVKNCSANLLFMLVAYWQDNYEDQILPRILESSPETVIAKDEYIVLNTVEPKEYCAQVMKNSTLEKVVERRLSLGESLIQELK
ncbi:MAG: hypothetical protein ACXVCP_18475 [Bdellovibrio sp.]